MQRVIRPAIATTRMYSTTATRSQFSKKVILLGAPGVGKGTYAKRASRILNVPTVAAGDLIRNEIASGSPVGEEMRRYTASGQLVPDSLVIGFLAEKLRGLLPSGSDGNGGGFLLDGFPRTVAQAEALDKLLQIDLAVNLTQRSEILIVKIASRRTCSGCGEIYNFADIREPDLYMPAMKPKVEGVCDKCGARDSLVQREDDREEVVRRRLEVYSQQTEPLLEYYQKRNVLKEFKVTGGAEALTPSFVKLLEEDV